MSYAAQHMREAVEIIQKMDVSAIEKVADLLATVKADGGRIFFLGVGGSAGNCSHAVNDFRKIVGIEAYAPTDNVSELTARTNDAYLTSKVKARFVDSKLFSAVHVKVVTEAATVYLLGLVTEKEAADATEIARTTGGVRKVVKIFQYCRPDEDACRPRQPQK